ncbi:MAG: hypothetical protein ACP5OE_10070, partial [Thermodesulfobium sp.]
WSQVLTGYPVSSGSISCSKYLFSFLFSFVLILTTEICNFCDHYNFCFPWRIFLFDGLPTL